MDEDNILNGFVEGFAKAAEDAGFHGAEVKTLMELSLDLAQRQRHPAEFDAGFTSVIVGN